MRANVPKAPRPWERLPSSQRKAIEEYSLELLRQQEEKDARIMLDLYTKMTVCVLHDGHEMDEDELICFLGNHKRLFQRHARMVREGTQLDYFNKRMAEIFPTSGFPQQFFDDMLGAVEEPVFDEEATAKVSRSDHRQKEGKWQKRGNEKTCSLCKFIYYSNNDEWNFCPNCGAVMKGGE